ncbi:hypothetical protein [Streptomyces atratus]|uniref:hypothetical protein n=1 Tax=Streptomyces atratus TaxID=1893 RepID=UPI003664B0BA
MGEGLLDRARFRPRRVPPSGEGGRREAMLMELEEPDPDAVTIILIRLLIVSPLVLLIALRRGRDKRDGCPLVRGADGPRPVDTDMAPDRRTGVLAPRHSEIL